MDCNFASSAYPIARDEVDLEINLFWVLGYSRAHSLNQPGHVAYLKIVDREEI